MNSIDNSERIERFLREQMTAEENEAFLRDMETDEALRHEAQLTALMLKELSEQQQRHDSEIIAEVVAAKNKARQARLITLAKWVGSVAAVVLLLFGTYIWFSPSDGGADYVALAEQYYNATPAATYRSGTTDADKELEHLFKLVGNNDSIPTVISRLKAINNNLDAEYAYRANGNEKRIAWYLALAYLKDNRPDDAKQLLQTIVADDKGTGLGVSAQSLLDKIEKQ